MSSGQGDAIGEISKDTESEISSTTDNGAIKPNKSELSSSSNAVPANADSTAEFSEPIDAIPVMSTNDGDGISNDNQDIDSSVASTTVELNAENSIDHTTVELNAENSIEDITTVKLSSKDNIEEKDGITSTEELECDKDSNITQVSSEIKDKILDIEPKASYSKEITDLILAEADKDSSSLGEELELRWEDDDEEENDETPTTDVLKILDRELGADTSNKRQLNDETDKLIESEVEITKEENVNPIKTDYTESNKDDKIIKDNKSESEIEQSVETSSDDKTIKIPSDTLEHDIENIKIHDNDDIEMLDGTSFEESNENVKNSDSSYQVDNLTQENKYQNIEEEELREKTDKIENPSENTTVTNISVTALATSPKDVEMDIDTLPEEISREPAKEPLNEELLKNKDITPKPIETSVMDVSEIGEVDAGNIEARILETNKTDIVKSQNSPSHVPSVTLPIEVSSTDDTKQNKDSDISITPEATISEQIEAKKDTQLTEDKIDTFDISQTEDVDNVSQENCLFDKTMTPNIHHRINKPNIMLDIPTQELSDIEAELDDDDLDYNEEKTQTHSFTIDSSPEESTDIEMKEPKDSKITEINAIVNTSVKEIMSPTIEIDGTTSKLNIKVVSPPKSVIPKSKLIPNTQKSLQFDIASTEIVESNDFDLTKVNQDDNDVTTTDLKPDNNEHSPEPLEEKDNKIPSSSEELMCQPSTSKMQPEIDNFTPSTSKSDALSEKLTHDNDEIQEITDSLGLLAESSRVMDDDNDDEEDAEDVDVDDVDDDEDFDPYEETNSEMAEDLDQSTSPPLESDPKELGSAEPPKPHEERESDEGTMDIAEGTMDIVDDIECVENELNMEIPDDSISETPTEENAKEDDIEVTDAGSNLDQSECPPVKIFNILEKVLGPKSLAHATNDSLVGSVKTFVELEASSDSDDVEEVSKSDATDSDVISVNIPKEVEVMSTSGARSTSEIVSNESEVIISKVPKPPPQKMSKINTSEVSIKTTVSSVPAIHIPETTSINKPKDEIFNLDSDDEETAKLETSPKAKEKASKKEGSPKALERKCVNPECTNETRTYYEADRATAAYYSLTKRSAAVCEQCRQRARERSEALINGIKDLRPLLELEMDAPSQQLVEISDSDEDEDAGDDTDLIGEKGAEFLEEHLVDMINETWSKYRMETRLRDTESYLMDELQKIEEDAKEIDSVLDECQKTTDSIRFDFYKNYEPRRKTLGAIVIFDTPFSSYSHTEQDIKDAFPETESRYPKRRGASIAYDSPAKKPAIPMGFTPLEGSYTEGDQNKTDDDKEDISVVKLSAEAAPADLPPCGEIVRPPLKAGMIIYAMRNAFGTWLKGKIVDVQPKVAGQQFTHCRVKFEHKVKNPCKVLPARCLAYPDPCDVRMTIGTRVVALFKDPQNPTRRESFYSGVIAEIPNPVNSYRYLVFFDDGYAQYVHHQDTRIVCESSNLVWEEVHPFIRDFICNYLLSYPERPMVRLHAKEKLKTEWNGKWWDSKVLQVDASIALINFDEDNRTEWIYRGSTRLAPLYLELQAAEKAGEGRARSRLPRSKAQMRSNMPCVEYTRSDEQASAKVTAETQAQQQHNEEMRRQRAVAKKSTTSAQAPSTVVSGTPFEGVISRVVYYTPKNAVKPYKMTPHTCSVKCRRSDLLSLKDLRTYNPLAKPLLSGWERQTVRYKGHRDVVYRAPCGRRLRTMDELHRYLRTLQSDLSVDLFDFTPGTHCLAEFVLHKCIVSKKDLSHGKENVPVPCVNYYDDSLPEFCSYNTERTPTAGVPLNLDPEFLCGCDCTDDCTDKSKCACWKMTLEGARTIGLEGPNVGYVYRRLPEPLPSGIYECNSRCKCKQTCLNRVAQHPLQLKLQVFKTINRGWGIRALNDVPKGSFLCIYAGNLLTDATANLDGLNEGDEYLAELDYIEVVEGMKEGYEDDVPDADKKLDKKGGSSDSESEPTTESDDEQDLSKKDGDFQPGYIPQSNVTFKKSLRKREKAKKKEEEKEEIKRKNDCITISDDEEVREPSRFTAQAGMVDRDLISKQSSRVSVRTLFGKDEACYIMDAKVQGNIGRYLNHSCHPNVFVQNVFVDTHDPRFPWVAFFALTHVRAGAELTWNYNYDVGSVPEKVLYCYCGAPNCRGRLL